MAGHLRIMNVWLPSVLSCAAMLLCITRMAVITTMMENTPTNTPSSVNDERNLCAVMAPMAIMKLSRASAKILMRRLFIAQGVHGVHARRAPRGEKSREHARKKRDEKRSANNPQRHLRGHDFIERQRRQPGDAQRNGAADQTDAGRLDQKLQQDGPPFRTDRLAPADFPRSFGDGHEHDVHDADAPDKQREAGDEQADAGDGAGDLVEKFQKLILLVDVEIVGFSRREVADLSQHIPQFFPGVVKLVEPPGLHLDFIIRLVQERVVELWQRDDHLVVRTD